jgi:hypothetical protein
MIAADRRVFEAGEEDVATWSSLNMHLLSPKSPVSLRDQVRI